jgi:hypothetical protein
MTPLVKLIALGTASIGAASVAWVVSTSPGESSQPASSNPRSGPAVCVGEDTVLRLIENSKDCPKGHERLDLAEAEEELPEWEDAGMDEPARGGKAASDGLRELQRRISELENRPLFEVVDKAGRPIFRVSPGMALVYNSSQAVAAIRATDEGGFFTGRSSSGLAASIGASGMRSGVRLSEGGVTRASLGSQEHGNHAMTFPSPGSGNIAAIGESRAGSGALVVGTFSGAVLASITGVDNKGAFGVSNQSGASVVSLTEGATRGGLLAIGDATSEPMVKMGVQDDRYGIALAGPQAGFPLIPASGLPGSYIMGCAGKGKECGPAPTIGR